MAFLQIASNLKTSSIDKVTQCYRRSEFEITDLREIRTGKKSAFFFGIRQCGNRFCVGEPVPLFTFHSQVRRF